MHEFLGGRRKIQSGHDVGGIRELQFHRLAGDTLLFIYDQLTLAFPSLTYAWTVRDVKMLDQYSQKMGIISNIE